MTRIIQRCFLLLAFTGILLSSAQETAGSEVPSSTRHPHETTPSIPESSFNSVETASSSWDKEVDNSAPISKAAAVETSSLTTEEDANRMFTDSSFSENHSAIVSKEDGPATGSSESELGTSSDSVYKSSTNTSTTSLTHSDGLFEAEPEGGESTDATLVSTQETEESTSRPDPEERITSSSASDVQSKEEATEAAVVQSGDVNISENASDDFGQSFVPSKEELDYNSSHVDRNQLPEKMFSTAPNKVQTEEIENSDVKKATRKRSLNATNTIIGSTTVLSTQETSTSLPVASLSSHAPESEAELLILDQNETIPARKDSLITSVGELPYDKNERTVASLFSHTLEPKDVTVVKDQKESFPTLPREENPNMSIDAISVPTATVAALPYDKNERDVTVAHATETELTRFPHITNSDKSDMGVSAVHFVESDYAMPESSSGFIQNTHMSPISSTALTLNDKSIHPFKSTDSTAQISTERHGLSATPSYPHRSSELEVEDEDSARKTYSTASLITFDPDGMTHNFPQDPDSVTFTPKVFHVDGMSTDGYLSHLEHEDSFSHKPDLVLDHFTTTGVFASSSHEMEEAYSPEREREMVSSPSHGLLPHDEPDGEEIASIHIAPNTQLSEVNQFSTTVSVTSESSKIILPLNDESEEMLNDSPLFPPLQSKPTAADNNKYIIKDLEINISNDITHSAGSNPQNAPKTYHELDFPNDYQTQQSEIRPVTAHSPLKTSESITILPDSHDVESHLASKVTTSGQPDIAVVHDTSSPIILPNPAPNFINQTAETTTIVLSPDILPVNYTFNLKLKEENDASINANSTIAGMAVKTSVSVSFPLSKSPNSTVNSSLESATDGANLSSNISGIILPLPIPVYKDADGHPPPTVLPTAAPAPSTTVSRAIPFRVPGLKNNSDNGERSTARTRKPFISPLQRPSTTAGPPVSIFKKARTRIASITSSTTARPLPQFSTFRIPYPSRKPGMVPGGELVFSSTEPVTTTVPTTTETEEPFSDEPFTEQTQGPIIPNEDDVTLMKVAGVIVIDKGLRWRDQLNNRYSPQYKERSRFVQTQLYRLFKNSPIATQLWKIEIDGFSGRRNSRSVVIDFIMYLIKTPNEISTEQLTSVFHDKLKNNTFSRFTVDTNKTAFEFLSEEPMRSTTVLPEEEQEPVIPQWAIAVIVVGAASLIFIVLFAAVAILGRHHVRRRYSNKLNDEDSDRPSDWESKMAAAYENLAADTIYDAEDLHSDTYKKSYLVD